MSEVPYSTVVFMNALAEAVPEAGEVIDETRHRHHGRLLPHVEMGDLTRWFIDECRLSRGSGPEAERAHRAIARFLWILEASFKTGDQPMDDLIAASFLENLHQAGDELPAIREMLPERMSDWYTRALG